MSVVRNKKALKEGWAPSLIEWFDQHRVSVAKTASEKDQKAFAQIAIDAVDRAVAVKEKPSNTDG